MTKDLLHNNLNISEIEQITPPNFLDTGRGQKRKSAVHSDHPQPSIYVSLKKDVISELNAFSGSPERFMVEPKESVALQPETERHPAPRWQIPTS